MKIIKKLLPDFVVRNIVGFFYGWSGNYKSWDLAAKKCSGYDAENILQKVLNSTLKVKNGEVKYERDSFIFDEIQYNYPLLSSLMWIAAQNKGNLRVLDFGGALGSTYFQNKSFLDSLPFVDWNIVEQHHFVEAGNRYIANNVLKFHNSIEECFLKHKIDVILLSSVIQYIEKPYELLDYILNMGVEFVIIDRTPFVEYNDRITVQKVNPKIYKASYPCWFFNKERFVNFLNEKYSLIMEFDALDRANIKSEFNGYLLRKKS